MPRHLFLLSIFFACTVVVGPPTCLGQSSNETSETHSQQLSDGWEHYQGSLGSTWEIWRGDAASDNVAWTSVSLPHCFNARDAVDPDVRYYQGPGWYRTRLKIDNPFPGGRTLLHFNGAGQRSEVFVYTEKVGEHVGGYDEWTVDITDAVAKIADGNVATDGIPIAVKCDNSRDAEMVPSDLSDFNRYGGLYRHVSLVYVPKTSIQSIHIEPTVNDDASATVDDASATVEVRSTLYNPTTMQSDVDVNVAIIDPDGNVIAEMDQTKATWFGESIVGKFTFDNLKRWSPDTPTLYQCRVTIKTNEGSHQLKDRFGIRTVEWVKNGPFKLNGERLLLRGTHYHEDHAGVAAAVPDDVVRQTMTQVKDMGANFIRLGHYQQAPLVLEMCDELGLLVWEEVPWCRGGVGGDQFKQQVRDMLRSLIDQHYNHPCVIMWGLGNENDWPGDFEVFQQDKVREFMKELNTIAHDLDPSRSTCIRRCDFCKDIVDVYSPSIWAGWYSGRYTEYRKSTEKAIADTDHFFHAEWGGDSHARRFAEKPEKMMDKVETGKGTAEKGKDYKSKGGRVRMSRDGDWSESYMANLFDWHLMEQETMPDLAGTAQWVFKDFSTPLRPENPVPLMNQKGLVERDGTPKEGYYIFQSYWSDKPMIRLFGHQWKTRWGAKGEAKEIRVYSNCDSAELFVNGESVGVKKRDNSDFPAAGLRWNVPLKEGENQLRAVGKKNGTKVTDEMVVGYQTDAWDRPAKLKLSEVGQANGVVTMEARMYDQNDVMCLDCADTVRFGLIGEGELVDNLGTSTGSRVVQMFNGLARIRAKMIGHKVCISVSSDGRKSQFKFVENNELVQNSTAEKQKSSEKTAASTVDVATIDKQRILSAAADALNQSPVSITFTESSLSEGGKSDFYSNGDYWWPDPSKPDGLPFIRRDGESNPDNFSAHRMAVKQLRDSVASLAAAYHISADDRYVAKAVELLDVFFLDANTKMNPSLDYAQAIPGITPGRGIGIIDALHLIEIPKAIEAMENSAAFPKATASGLRAWFADLATWMTTSGNGIDESTTKNNHAVAFYLQLAVYADFTNDQDKLAQCRRQFKDVFLPDQMALDGSFPRELERTKPYGYSIFQLDNMATMCQVLSDEQNDLWSFELKDGRGIELAINFLYPFLNDKSSWTLSPDLQAWDGWPARQPFLLFGGLAFDQPKFIELWKGLPADPSDPEVQRNIAITQPLLWIK